MSIFIAANMRRSSQESITFKDASGALVSISVSDIVRIKIGRSGDAPLLDIRSYPSGGPGPPAPPDGTYSSVTGANPAVLKLHQDDLVAGTIKPGVYDIEASVIDSGESNKIKHAETGVFSLHDTPLGGLT